MQPIVCSLQAFALLVRAQQLLTTHLDRPDQGGQVPDEAPADEAGPDSLPEQHLFKMLQVCNPAMVETCTKCHETVEPGTPVPAHPLHCHF